jgi:flagellar basal-body rod protein FlgB
VKLFDDSVRVLEAALDVRGQRHTVLASNLANADTAGYIPLDVDFQSALDDQLAAQDGATPAIEAKASESLAGPGGIDGNRVDVDRTLTAMTENGMQYSAVARAASKKLAILRYVAGDGVG